MSDPFVGEIRLFGFNFAPQGWAQCNGQLLPISQNTALFSILGTTYGGDGRTTFGLPNLQGQAPLHTGQGPGLSDRQLGESGGNAERQRDAASCARRRGQQYDGRPVHPDQYRLGYWRRRAWSELLHQGRRRRDEQPGTGGDRRKPTA
jgi:hypothetical protein